LQFQSKKRSACTNLAIQDVHLSELGTSPSACFSHQLEVCRSCHHFCRLHAIAAKRGDGLRPELLALFEHLRKPQGAVLPLQKSDGGRIA